MALPDKPISAVDIAHIPSKSGRIRFLKDLGYRQADIARHLGIRDQHVSNVVRGPRPKHEARTPTQSVSEPSRPFRFDGPLPSRIVVEPGGVVRLPHQWGVSPGAAFIARKLGNSIVLMDVTHASEAARTASGPDSAVDALIAERRLEAMREFDD